MNKQTRDAITDFGRMLCGVRRNGSQKFLLVPVELARVVHGAAKQEVNRIRTREHLNRTTKQNAR